MARIEVGEGQGSVGRSIYAKLRELKHLHEVAWGDEFRYKTQDEFTDNDRKLVKRAEKNDNEHRPVRGRKERGFALNAQKHNTIADLAVVLAGQGRGNLVAPVAEDGTPGPLGSVTVRWANDQDKNYAESWSNNVTHDMLEQPAYVSESVEATPAAKAAEPKAAA